MERALRRTLLVAAPPCAALAVLALVLSGAHGGAARAREAAGTVRVPLADAQVMAKLPRIAGPQDRSRPLVVIDAGHGGFDPGAVNGPVEEKTVALAMAMDLRAELLALGGIRVALTREDDRFLTLAERPAIVRAMGAALFLSIHADSAANHEARGASIYVLSARGSNEAAVRLAARENSADTVNGVALSGAQADVAAILLDLSQREAEGRSATAAALILRELAGKTELHSTEVEAAALAVLKAPDVPSCLLETGYLSNAADVARLSDEADRRTIARATAQAVRIYLARVAGT